MSVLYTFIPVFHCIKTKCTTETGWYSLDLKTISYKYITTCTYISQNQNLIIVNRSCRLHVVIAKSQSQLVYYFTILFWPKKKRKNTFYLRILMEWPHCKSYGDKPQHKHSSVALENQQPQGTHMHKKYKCWDDTRASLWCLWNVSHSWELHLLSCFAIVNIQ